MTLKNKLAISLLAIGLALPPVCKGNELENNTTPQTLFADKITSSSLEGIITQSIEGIEQHYGLGKNWGEEQERESEELKKDERMFAAIYDENLNLLDSIGDLNKELYLASVGKVITAQAVIDKYINKNEENIPKNIEKRLVRLIRDSNNPDWDFLRENYDLNIKKFVIERGYHPDGRIGVNSGNSASITTLSKVFGDIYKRRNEKDGRIMITLLGGVNTGEKRFQKYLPEYVQTFAKTGTYLDRKTTCQSGWIYDTKSKRAFLIIAHYSSEKESSEKIALISGKLYREAVSNQNTNF